MKTYTGIKHILLLALLLSGFAAQSQEAVVGTWEVDEPGMKRSITLSADGTGEYVMGQRTFTISEYKVDECKVRDQYVINVALSIDNEVQDTHMVLNLEDPANIRCNISSDSKQVKKWKKKRLKDGVRIHKI